jgi:hypothetical protein
VKLRTAILCLQLGLYWPALAESLKEVYDAAGPAPGYDKYLVLQTGATYTGGLWIGATFNRMTAEFEGRGENVRIVGNGALLDLQGGEICMAYCPERLDIDDCVILNGDIKFRGYDGGGLTLVPAGSVRYVTFYKPHDYGVRLFGCGADVLVERNIVVDAVDTGPDFMFLTGIASDWLPTGASFSLSLQAGAVAFDCWSYHSDPVANADALRHFNLLCDYG